jgi:hypothetical protein
MLCLSSFSWLLSLPTHKPPASLSWADQTLCRSARLRKEEEICVQTYLTDEGWLYITVNGVQFSALFDAETRSTASFVAQQFADQISSYFGVSVTVDQDGYGEYSSIVSVEIAGDYTLSDAQTAESNPDVCPGCSIWHIGY